MIDSLNVQLKNKTDSLNDSREQVKALQIELSSIKQENAAKDI